MMIKQEAVPFESNKRKKKNAVTRNIHDCKLKPVKKRGGENSSSFSSKKDSGDHRKKISEDDHRKAAQQCPANRAPAEQVVAYYNNEVGNNYTMEITWIRETIYQSLSPTFIYFTCFDAKLIAKDTKEIKYTNCRSVILNEFDTKPKVCSLKLGALKDVDIRNWFKWRPARMVLYSESGTELEPAPRVEEADSDIEYEDDDAEEEEEDADARTKPRKYRCCSLPPAWVRQLANEAVAHHNKKEGNAKMKLGKTKEVFVHDVGVHLCHIKFNSRLIYKDGKETKRTTCQAVVSSPHFGGIKVWSLRFPSLEGNKTNDWCCKNDECKCEIIWNENEELLKYACPDWYFPSDDEQVESNKMKHESPKQLHPPLNQISRLQSSFQICVRPRCLHT